jgi:hypothetical protein
LQLLGGNLDHLFKWRIILSTNLSETLRSIIEKGENVMTSHKLRFFFANLSKKVNKVFARANLLQTYHILFDFFPCEDRLVNHAVNFSYLLNRL